MGWILSPPIFCTATQTVADVTNTAIKAGPPHVPHPLPLVDLASVLDQPISLPLLTNSVGPNPSQEPPKAGGVRVTVPEPETTLLAEMLATTATNS